MSAHRTCVKVNSNIPCAAGRAKRLARITSRAPSDIDPGSKIFDCSHGRQTVDPPAERAVARRATIKRPWTRRLNARPSFRLAAIFALAFSAAAVAATEKPTEEAQVRQRLEKKQKDKSLLDLYLVGGWLMHPIAACSLGTVAVGIHACLLTMRRRLAAPHILPHLQHALAYGRIQEAYDMCHQNPGLFTDALAAALLKTDADAEARSAMQQSAADSLAHEETRCMYWINYLNVFATVAPMLGLLGTVTGMIQAFDTLASGQTEPQDLAGGISEAMITTAGGLIVGIPAMLLYLLYRNNLQSAVTDAQRSIASMLDGVPNQGAAGDDEQRDDPPVSPQPEPAPS